VLQQHLMHRGQMPFQIGRTDAEIALGFLPRALQPQAARGPRAIRPAQSPPHRA
jgi:hypothetical protein